MINWICYSMSFFAHTTSHLNVSERIFQFCIAFGMFNSVFVNAAKRIKNPKKLWDSHRGLNSYWWLPFWCRYINSLISVRNFDGSIETLSVRKCIYVTLNIEHWTMNSDDCTASANLLFKWKKDSTKNIIR